MKLSWNKVTKYYGDKKAVDSFSLDVEEGELMVLIGPSGCGKTTNLKMVNRLVAPSEGTVSLDGRDVADLEAVEMRRGIGYVIQQVGLFPHMRVADNIATVPRLLNWDKKRIRKRVEELLDLVGLPHKDYANSWPSKLSGGEAQRVGVARALAADPPVLLMDEPFGAVDPLTRDTLQREFLRIREEVGKTIVFVTHDLDEAIRLADRIAVMKDGALAAVETPKELLLDTDPFVREFTGDDRALKRLASLKVGSLFPDAPSQSTDGNGKAMLPPGAIGMEASLKDALALMLDGGANSVEVVSDGNRLASLTVERIFEYASGEK